MTGLLGAQREKQHQPGERLGAHVGGAEGCWLEGEARLALDVQGGPAGGDQRLRVGGLGLGVHTAPGKNGDEERHTEDSRERRER